MSAVPSGTRSFAITPSSIASYSMVALSVSISARMSPALTVSPSFFSHLARLPFSMVGDSAGIRMLIGMASTLLSGDFLLRGFGRNRPHGLGRDRFGAHVGGECLGDLHGGVLLAQAFGLRGI